MLRCCHFHAARTAARSIPPLAAQVTKSGAATARHGKGRNGKVPGAKALVTVAALGRKSGIAARSCVRGSQGGSLPDLLQGMHSRHGTAQHSAQPTAPPGQGLLIRRC